LKEREKERERERERKIERGREREKKPLCLSLSLSLSLFIPIPISVKMAQTETLPNTSTEILAEINTETDNFHSLVQRFSTWGKRTPRGTQAGYRGYAKFKISLK
jgi:hypothetical protein